MPYTCRALRMSLNLSYWVEWVKLGVRWFAYASTCSATFHIRFSSIVDYATRLRIRCSACFGLSRLPHPPPAWELAGYVCQEQTLLLATHISRRPCMFWISRLSLQRKGLYAASLFRWRDEWVDTNLLGAQHVFVKWLSLQHWRLSLAAQTTLACLFFFTVDPVVVETLSLFLEPLRPKYLLKHTWRRAGKGWNDWVDKHHWIRWVVKNGLCKEKCGSHHWVVYSQIHLASNNYFCILIVYYIQLLL